MRPLALALLLSLSSCAGRAPLPPRAVALNDLGLAALDDGDLPTAEARFSLALEYHPAFVEAQVNLGLVEVARGNHERARALFTKARRINADLPHPHHGLGVLAQKEGKLGEAAGHFRQALKVDPGFSPARENLARALFDAGQLHDAREQASRLTEASPDDERGPALLYETLRRLGRDDEASQVLEQAVERVGATPSLSLLVARDALERGKVDQAIELLELLSARGGKTRPRALSWLAVARFAGGDLDACIDAATRALGEDPHDPVALFALASALEQRSDPAAPALKERLERVRSWPGPSRHR